jgi:hypothetical protein
VKEISLYGFGGHCQLGQGGVATQAIVMAQKPFGRACLRVAQRRIRSSPSWSVCRRFGLRQQALVQPVQRITVQQPLLVPSKITALRFMIRGKDVSSRYQQPIRIQKVESR